MDIEANLHQFLFGDGRNLGIKPSERYSSFDYCFNYFQSFRENGNVTELTSEKNMQLSCLQLGFYLASWGMLRGSSFLLSKSVRVFEPLIEKIARADPKLWTIDVNCYTPSNINLILEFRKTVISAFAPSNFPTDILVTKIMLGVFGNVPAFDTNFRRGIGVSTFGKSALNKVARFYEGNQTIIEEYRIPTLDFSTGEPTQRRYTRAKVIDMIFFIEGS